MSNISRMNIQQKEPEALEQHKPPPRLVLCCHLANKTDLLQSAA